MRNEILINTQLALFFDQPISRPDEIFNSLNDKMDNIFDLTPFVIPVPDEKQLIEVPVVRLNSKNNIYSCNIARGRVDFFHSGAGDQKFQDIAREFVQEVEKLSNFFINNEILIKRIGFVTRFFIEDECQDVTISKLLPSDFVDIHGGSVYESYIRYVSRINIASLETNNFTSIEKYFARISGISGDKKGILITRDFNTSLEQIYAGQLKESKILQFVSETQEKFDLDKIKIIIWPEK